MKYKELTHYEVVVTIYGHLYQSEHAFEIAYLNHTFFEKIPVNERLLMFYNCGKPMEEIFSTERGVIYTKEYIDHIMLKTRNCMKCEYIDEGTYKMYMDYLEYIRNNSN